MEDSRVIAILRAQAWEKAKGELNAMLHTYHYIPIKGTPKSGSKFERIDKAINLLIKYVEDHGLHEGD